MLKLVNYAVGCDIGSIMRDCDIKGPEKTIPCIYQNHVNINFFYSPHF